MAQKIIAGNWKMNLDIDQSVKLIRELNTEKFDSDVRIILFPPSLFIDRISKVIESSIQLGVQNFSNNYNGAYTGEISINQVKSVGAKIGLIGHSERRSYYNEGDDILRYKVNQAVKHNFEFIFSITIFLEYSKLTSLPLFTITVRQLDPILFSFLNDLGKLISNKSLPTKYLQLSNISE